GSTLVRLAPGKRARAVTTVNDRITQIAVRQNSLILRDNVGRILRVAPSGGNAEPLLNTAYDLVATSRSSALAAASGRRIWTQIVPQMSGQQRGRWVDMPSMVTSLAMSERGVVAVGLQSGETVVLPPRERADGRRTLSGDGAALTAMAVCRDDSTITGSQGGHVRWWPPDPSHGSVLFQRPGAVSAIVRKGPWVRSGGGGRVAGHRDKGPAPAGARDRPGCAGQSADRPGRRRCGPRRSWSAVVAESRYWDKAVSSGPTTERAAGQPQRRLDHGTGWRALQWDCHSV